MIHNKIIIIGGGIGGLASAALLSRDGYKVKIIEQNNTIGGRARVLKKNGFSFDMGPSWYMMPDVFEKFFSLFNKKSSDFYTLVNIDPRYKIFLSSGTEYTLESSMSQNKKLFDSIEKGAGQKLEKFLEDAKKLYEKALDKPIYLDYTNYLDVLKLAIPLLSPKLFMSYHSIAKRYFKNEDLQKIIEFSTMFLGGSPHNTPALYTLIAHTDYFLKIWYPLGGMVGIVDALAALCAESGVEINTSESVSSIIVKKGRATGVKTNKGTYDADIVICNADYHHGETKLLDTSYQTYPEKYWSKKLLSPSCFLMYVGIKGKLKNVAHHNLYFESSWDEHYDTVYRNPRWPEKPCYYVHIPSITDSSLAPAGCESLMFLIPISTELEDTEQIHKFFSKKILSHFEKVINQPLQENVVTQTIFSKSDFMRDYNSYKGSAFGLAHTLTQTAFLRPLNKSTKVKNLYYVGQHTNPGIGVPICLVSAQIVHKLITNEAHH